MDFNIFITYAENTILYGLNSSKDYKITLYSVFSLKILHIHLHSLHRILPKTFDSQKNSHCTWPSLLKKITYPFASFTSNSAKDYWPSKYYGSTVLIRLFHLKQENTVAISNLSHHMKYISILKKSISHCNKFNEQSWHKERKLCIRNRNALWTNCKTSTLSGIMKIKIWQTSPRKKSMIMPLTKSLSIWHLKYTEYRDT